MQTMETAVYDLPLGAHLITRRRGYVHHGIHAGGGRVIHYGGFKRFFIERSPVEEVSLQEFARGGGWEVKPSVAPKYTGEAAVARARSRLGENRYRLWTNNCEHFVAWCISGAAESAQVDAWKQRLGLMPLAGRAAAAA